MVWDRAGKPNAERDGPFWAGCGCRQEATAGRGGEGRNLQELSDS